MNWSPQQKAALDWAVTGTGSSIIEAVAGAGKTTLILGIIDVIKGQSAILAYNKKIAEEIKAKLVKKGIDYKTAQAGTVHSFGFSAYRKAYPKAKVDGDKVANIVEQWIEEKKIAAEVGHFSAIICHLVSLAKQRAVGLLTKIDNTAEWYAIIDHFDLIEDEKAAKYSSDIVDTAQKVLKASNDITDIVDFDDMVYLPVLFGVRFWKFDNVFVDEAQDTNPARRALVRAILKKGGRAIFVGDPRQSVYGFTGADSDSLDQSAKDFNCTRLPLTVTYRCPKKVVEFAHKWVSHITAHESAPEGSVSSSTFAQLLQRKDLNGEAVILCRNTAPLVTSAFALIRHKIACRIEGREIGVGLKKLATRWSSIKTIDALVVKLDEYAEREIAKALAKKQEAKAQSIEDQVATLKVIINQCREEKKTKIIDVEAQIDSIFADNVSGILTLSTIHKSKGREWQRVFWLDRAGTCPSRYARQDWQQLQEANLQYVACTRSQDELIELSPPQDKDRGL